MHICCFEMASLPLLNALRMMLTKRPGPRKVCLTAGMWLSRYHEPVGANTARNDILSGMRMT